MSKKANITNKLVTIRRAIQNNKGKLTPGLNSKVYLTNTAKEFLF